MILMGAAREAPRAYQAGHPKTKFYSAGYEQVVGLNSF